VGKTDDEDLNACGRRRETVLYEGWIRYSITSRAQTIKLKTREENGK
jgi:hypothetical protein